MKLSKTALALLSTAAVMIGSTAYGDAVADSRNAALAQTSVYRIGYPVEVAVASGKGLGKDTFAANATATKHYAMGRLAWELAYVMPDHRTAYAGDDGTNRGMFRFVADKPTDLSSGMLYAAKLIQKSDKGAAGGSFDVEWIEMGHASNSEIDAAIAAGVTFADLFDVAEVTADACAAGFTPIEIESGAECLKLKTENRLGMSADDIAKVASRVETLRYGAILGATTEFRKFEGVTFDPKRNKLYIAVSQVSKAMSGAPKLAGVSDDINIKSNNCGAVYQLSVNADMATTDMELLVAGGPFDKNASLNACDINNIASPDNVSMGPTEDLLFIGEDTDYHQNDVLWAYDLNNATLTRIFTTPYGSETTSPMYYKDIDADFDYMIAVVQHPYGESDEDMATSDADTRAYIGYVAIPAKVQATDTVRFHPLPFAQTDAQKREARFTDAMTVNGATVALPGYQVLLRSGDKIGDTIFGQHIAKDGTPMVNFSKMDLPNGISTSPDHTTLIKTDADELFSITQFEEGTGNMFISSLDMDKVSGTLTVTGMKPVDLAPAYGGFTFCAGVPTAWGTHLGGEEYPTNARAFAENGQIDKSFDRYLEYFGFNPKAQ